MQVQIKMQMQMSIPTSALSAPTNLLIGPASPARVSGEQRFPLARDHKVWKLKTQFFLHFIADWINL